MALNKGNINLSFAQGLDLKSDPWQITPGNMLELENGLFTKNKLLMKRNGFAELPAIPDPLINTCTTFKKSLTAIGASLYAYVPEIKKWYNKGLLTSVGLSVSPMVRSAESQIHNDSATTDGGLTCTVWEEAGGTSKYQVQDLNAQIISPATSLPATAIQPKVVELGGYFIVTFLVTVGPGTRLRYIAIPKANPTASLPVAELATVVLSLSAPYDITVANNTLYAAYQSTATVIRLVYLTSSLGVSSTVTLTPATSVCMTLFSDISGSTPTIFLAYGVTGPNAVKVVTYSASLAFISGPYTIASVTDTIPNVTGVATGGVCQVLLGQTAPDVGAGRTDDIYLATGTTSIPLTGGTRVARGVGLASKAFTVNDKLYALTEYAEVYQPTYFLYDFNAQEPVAKLAYQNGGLEPTLNLPSVSQFSSKVYLSYLFKDLITAVNKSQGTSQPGIYSQTGVNLVQFDVNTIILNSAEIGNNLHISGGYLSMYDGAYPVEHGFHLYPEGVKVAYSASPGNVGAGTYFYQVTYEWTDAQGNLHRSAPSIPVEIVVPAAPAVISLVLPTLRVTKKKDVRIVIYRWSAAQPAYYQVTPIATPLLNNRTVNTVTYTDSLSDAEILGNQLIYTTGGVIENIGAPACTSIALFKSRLFLIDAEDEDVIWYSKQVIQTTPVETSDLFTLYASPSQGAMANTGGAKVIATLDDKLIIFKSQAAYYVTGNGPDNTGSQNDFSDPVIITATVGCSNPQSIVLTPNGLMFQSQNGIWLLGRDLSTTYIGAPVEAYNNVRVLSAVNVAGSNQVRFGLANGTMLMYDYYYGQWGTFANVPAISSTMFEGLHTYVDQYSRVFQESPGKYLDGSKPVLMKFTTGWFSLAGLQGLERAYFFYLLGKYISPHTLTIGVAINYEVGIVQTATITPDNFSPLYGEDPGPYGSGTPYGGVTAVEQWRVFFETQKVESFQLTVTESYDSTYGAPAGAGLTLSGLNLVVGIKKGYTTLKASRSTG